MDFSYEKAANKSNWKLPNLRISIIVNYCILFHEKHENFVKYNSRKLLPTRNEIKNEKEEN